MKLFQTHCRTAARNFLGASALLLACLGNAQDLSSKPDASKAMPTNPGNSALDSSGMVTPPPATGTESKTIKVPSPQVDPAITKPTEQIDRQNRQKSRDKLEAK